MAIRFIGFFGIAKAGKTTAAHTLVDELNRQGRMAYTKSFAGPLKEGLKVMGIYKDIHPDMYRTAAQFMGTEICREYAENWWVDQMRHSIEGLPDDAIVVVDDCRFINEFDFIREMGGDMVFVDAGHRVIPAGKIYTHRSERIAMNFLNCMLAEKDGGMPIPPLVTTDYILDNTTGHIEMTQDLRRIMDQIMEIK